MVKNETAIVFPGQGSQKVGMAATFADHPQAKLLFEEADDVLHFGLSKLMFEGDEATLGRTINTQPALLLAGVVALRVWEDVFEQNIETMAAYVAGHSLGEYTALVAAGVLRFADALRLVRLRGEAMQQAVPEGVGKMAALLGLSAAQAAAVAQQTGVYVANDNAVGQIVLSGGAEGIEKACALGKELGAKRAVVLPVSAPFHCPLIAPAATVMEAAFKTVVFHAPKLPVISNVQATPVTQAEAWSGVLTQQITHTVRWTESMQYLANQGVKTLVELGSGKVLSGLSKRCDDRLESLPLDTLQAIIACKAKQTQAGAA